MDGSCPIRDSVKCARAAAVDVGGGWTGRKRGKRRRRKGLGTLFQCRGGCKEGELDIRQLGGHFKFVKLKVDSKVRRERQESNKQMKHKTRQIGRAHV